MYEANIIIDFAADLPMTAKEGMIGYARDTKRHYKFTGTQWKSIATTEENNASIAMKSNIGHTHVVADVSGLDAFLGDKAGKDDYAFYSSGSRIKPLREYSGTATSTLGQFVFYLTSDGTASGTALFTSSVIIGTANLVILDPAGGNYKEGSYTLSADKKSLTVTVKKESFAGLTILTNINVLGSNSWPSIPAGVTGHISIKGW